VKYSTLSICNLFRIKVLPPLVFENLNSLETLNLQNNRLQHISEEVTENIVDTLRHIDITGNILSFIHISFIQHLTLTLLLSVKYTIISFINFFVGIILLNLYLFNE